MARFWARSLVFTVLLVALLPARAEAQKLRIGVGAALDFAGSVDPNFGGPGVSPDDALKLTAGVRGHLDYAVHRFVSVGGFARVAWWEGKDIFYERSPLIDLGLRATGHYTFRTLRFYVSLMAGPSLSVLRDLTFGTQNPGAGVAIMVAPGFEWWFSPRVGLYTEVLGWSGHFFSHDYGAAPGDLDLAMSQVLLQAGVVFLPKR